MHRAWTTGVLLAAALALSACGSSGARWSPPPPPTHLTSASVVSSYCSTSYQAQFGWSDPEKAARVCHCESKGNPRAVSPNGLYAGLFQFSRDTWKSLGGGDVFDPMTNSARAHRLWQRRGFRPWPTCGKR